MKRENYLLKLNDYGSVVSVLLSTVITCSYVIFDAVKKYYISIVAFCTSRATHVYCTLLLIAVIPYHFVFECDKFTA